MEPVADVEGDIPQSQPLDDNQVPNNAGGFVYKIDDFARLKRFVILGSEANNYYVSSSDLQLENCACVLRLLADGHGERVVEEVTRISREGRAPRQGPGILVLAVCARLGNAATRHAALAALPAVCRTASTLFEMVQHWKELGPVTRACRPGDAAADPRVVSEWLQQQRNPPATTSAGSESDTPTGGRGGGGRGGRGFGRGGGRGRGRAGGASRPLAGASSGGKASWGRSVRRAVALWYLDKSPAAVAYQVTKYSQRHGWSHADLLRLAHPDPEEYVAKRRKVAAEAKEAEAKKAETEAETKEAGPAAAPADGAAATASPPEAAADSDWVMVSQAAEGEGEGEAEPGGDTSELGALTAAMHAVAVAAAEGDGGDAAAAASAVEAQRVADMKAIFDFLTHGTLPGQKRPERRVRAKTQAEGASDPSAGEAGAAAMEAEASGAAAEKAAGAASETATTPQAVPMEDSEATPAAAAPASASAEPLTAGAGAIGDAAADPTAADADASSAPILSPVMQYLVDAHRLRKEIRAPPPLVKTPPAERKKGGKRSRSRAVEAETLPEPDAAAAAPPPLDPAVVAAHAAAEAAAVGLAVSLVRRHRFGHEHVGDTALLRVPELWATFLEVGMPLTALVRNLGRMTQLGVTQRPDCLQRITARLQDPRALAAARVHPMTLLDALCTYRSGKGARGVAHWVAVPAVCEALEAAFYLAFKNVRPTGQRYMIGLDVSGSMGFTQCAGMTSLSCRQAAAAMLMTLVRTEPWVKTLAFSHTLVPMEVSASDKLEEVVARAEAIPMGGTDCALPILHALEASTPLDVFIILTDNETWFGNTHPTEALRRYRTALGLPTAKLVVLAFSATSFSIADPADPGMLDIAGLDSAVPQLVADFAAGRL